MGDLCRASCLRFGIAEIADYHGAASLHVGREGVRDHHVSEYGILGARYKVAKVIFFGKGLNRHLLILELKP